MSLLPSLPIWIRIPVALAAAGYFARQCRKPAGPLGRLVVALMNRSHSSLTTWALKQVTIADRDTVLDIGCGGGRTLQRLAALATQGKVCGVDYASASVAASRSLNRAAIMAGRVEIQQARFNNCLSPTPRSTSPLPSKRTTIGPTVPPPFAKSSASSSPAANCSSSPRRIAQAPMAPSMASR